MFTFFTTASLSNFPDKMTVNTKHYYNYCIWPIPDLLIVLLYFLRMNNALLIISNSDNNDDVK